MNDRHGTFWERLVRGTRWTWLDERFRGALPNDLAESVMSIESRDRLHEKQGRSTARVVFHGPSGPVPVYLKRHYRLPWLARVAALLDPSGKHTPGAAEFAHLSRARKLGLAVPDVVAAGERIGPWGHLQSFLMVAELTGFVPLHEALPALSCTMEKHAFSRLKREIVREMAEIASTLHRDRVFHQDLYLCHFFLDTSRIDTQEYKLTLIDLHRLSERRYLPAWGSWKDLGQLLYSTEGVRGVSKRDCLRFWIQYRRMLDLGFSAFHRKMIEWKAARYLRHNQ